MLPSKTHNPFYFIDQTSFEGGELIITTHRILWGRPGVIPRGQTCLALNLSLIVYIEEESPSAFSFSRSRKVVLHLSDPDTSMIYSCIFTYLFSILIH